LRSLTDGTKEGRELALIEARAADQAGAFAIGVEGVAPDLADDITRSVSCPTIGIGASLGCGGQILVTEDPLVLFDWSPKFVRRSADVRSVINAAIAGHARDVRESAFPSQAELYAVRVQHEGARDIPPAHA